MTIYRVRLWHYIQLTDGEIDAALVNFQRQGYAVLTNGAALGYANPPESWSGYFIIGKPINELEILETKEKDRALPGVHEA